MIPEFVRYIAAAVVVIGLLSYPNTQAYCVLGKL